ncbi:MAG TPA: hypothetical protein PLW35_13750 [Verrucomicrobiota bacterium]|nr:hypothetical protein [Verrucomicrobiota bacterium]
MSIRTRDLVLLGVVVCVAAVSLFLGLGGRSPKIDLGVYEALGAITAEETAKLLQDKAKLILIARDTGPDKNPSLEAQIDAFRQVLKKYRRLSVTVERFIASPMTMMATGGGIPPDQFSQILEKHKDIGTIVVFCPLPPLADSDVALLKSRKTKIVVASSFRPDYSGLMKQGVVEMVIAPKQEPPPSDAPQPRTLRELFDREFVILRITDMGAGN